MRHNSFVVGSPALNPFKNCFHPKEELLATYQSERCSLLQHLKYLWTLRICRTEEATTFSQTYICMKVGTSGVCVREAAKSFDDKILCYHLHPHCPGDTALLSNISLALLLSTSIFRNSISEPTTLEFLPDCS
jgi:hypothetical protein